MAATALMWGAAIDVPSAVAKPPFFQQDRMPTPGAEISIDFP